MVGGLGFRVQGGGLKDPQYMGVSQNSGYLFGGPYNKDYSILVSILGSPYFGKLPYTLLYWGILPIPQLPSSHL